MLIDLTKASLFSSLLKQVIGQLKNLSDEDMAMHKLIGTLQGYMQSPAPVDSSKLTTDIESAKEIASSYVEHDKELPSLFWHLLVEVQHITDSQRLSAMPIVPKHATLLIDIERLRSHGIRR
jgi:hypothetical protein